jgi:hypothetical protein
VSVVITTHNLAEYLLEAIESVTLDMANRDWELIAKYEIPAALPIGANAITQPIQSFVREGIYLAGDGQVSPSQNGALKSGRLAALAVLAN